MTTKLQLTTTQTDLLKIIAKKKPQSKEALAGSKLTNNDLHNLQEIKWNELDIKPCVLSTMQLVKGFVPGALAIRKKLIKDNAGNFNVNKRAKRQLHHVDISLLTGCEDDFTETRWLHHRGNEGQTRQKNAEIINLIQPEQQSAVA